MAHTFVKEVMVKNVISIDMSMTVKDAAIMMNDAKVGCIIVTKDNVPVGILTERDFVQKIVTNEKSLSTPVSEVMSAPIIKVNSEDTVWEAAEIMKLQGIHKLPVQDGNKVVGIVTATDIVKLCSLGSDSEMRHLCDQILLRLKNS